MIKISAVAQRTAALAAAGAMLISFSMPALAEKAAASDDSAKQTASANSPKAAEKTYCIAEPFTGTRLGKKVCKTKREWAAEGVEVAAK